MFTVTGQGSPAQVGDLRISFLPATEETALYDFDHERRCLFLAHLRIKSAPVERILVRLELLSLNEH